MFTKKSEAGFNLVELMVVVSIIGILSSVAVPRFNSFRARAQQTEAKGGLSGLFLSAQAYMANANEFIDTGSGGATALEASVAGIGFVLDGARPQYAYLLSSKPTGWAAVASSVKAGTKEPQLLANGYSDFWRINANKWLCSPFDAVSALKANAPGGTTSTLGPQCAEQFDATKGTAKLEAAIIKATDEVTK